MHALVGVILAETSITCRAVCDAISYEVFLFTKRFESFEIPLCVHGQRKKQTLTCRQTKIMNSVQETFQRREKYLCGFSL
jgi:hypothetical protein